MPKAPLPCQRYGRVLRIPTPTGFAVGDINVYVILPEEGGGSPILIDTGVRTDAAWAALESGLGAHGFKVRDLELVLLTHAHPDHFGQAARIRRAAGCEVWLHEDAGHSLARFSAASLAGDRLEVARHHMLAWGVPEERAGDVRGSSDASAVVEPLEPDRWLSDGDQIDIPGFRLRTVHTPGHCPEQVVFVQDEQRLAFSGDHLLPDITPVCLIQFPDRVEDARKPSLLEYERSLTKAEALPLSLVFPSHGDVITDTPGLIASYRHHIESRKRKIESELRESALTAYGLAEALFGRAVESQLFLVMSEVVGHLDSLIAEGRVVERVRSGVRFFSCRDSSD